LVRRATRDSGEYSQATLGAICDESGKQWVHKQLHDRN